jgi:hypothetical protein
MAIQLNDRDHLIFKLIDEHQVLLEKHLSWFLSTDDKPILIRDRLRKLFYLDYLLCHRHATKLPWWSTPTKPLVYLLSPMSRGLSGFSAVDIDLLDGNVQRHFLEIANLRMLCLMAQKDGQLSGLSWTTCKESAEKLLDVKISFANGGAVHKIGIVNHPADDQSSIEKLSNAVKVGDVQKILIISRDEVHQQKLQSLLATSSVKASCFFATHQELYKTGIVKALWQNSDCAQVALFVTPMISPDDNWGSGYKPSTSSAIA